jgi:hypothetical protein
MSISPPKGSACQASLNSFSVKPFSLCWPYVLLFYQLLGATSQLNRFWTLPIWRLSAYSKHALLNLSLMLESPSCSFFNQIVHSFDESSIYRIICSIVSYSSRILNFSSHLEFSSSIQMISLIQFSIPFKHHVCLFVNCRANNPTSRLLEGEK